MHRPQKGPYTRSWPISNFMYYYEIVASKQGRTMVHTEYVAFARRSDADVLRQELRASYDVVGVTPISRREYMRRIAQI